MIGDRAIQVAGCAEDVASDEIPTADDDGELHPKIPHGHDLCSDVIERIRVQTKPLITRERLAADLQQYSRVLN